MKYENVINLCEVSLFRYKDFVIFLSPKGRVVLNYPKKDDFQYQLTSGLIKVKKSSLVENRLESVVSGLKEFYHRKLNLIGIGFRAWCYFDNTRNCQVLCIKVGLSKDVLIFIPSDIVVLCLRPTLILLKGIDKKSVSLLACRIRSIKVPDAYKGKGIRYDNEIVRIKPGKQK
jgi:large subunit ribosomal protein L6